MATVYVPSPLRRLTGGQSKLSVQGKTIRELLTGLERQYPGIRQQVCDETGEVRSFINVFVNGTEIRQLQGMATPLKDADEVSIIPAMAGGQHKNRGIGDLGLGIREPRGQQLQLRIPNPQSLIP